MYKKIFITVTFASALMASTAWSADIGKSDLPAVSGINGKIELSAGWADIDPIDPTAVFRGGRQPFDTSRRSFWPAG